MQLDPSAGAGETHELESRLRDELKPGLEVLRLLGRGSMASVFLARESALRRLVALKVLSPQVARTANARQRFEREGQAVASIIHPNVVTVYHVDRLSDATPFLVMQYVKGASLEERLVANGPLEMAEVRRVLADLASALAAAHQRGIIHRDVRPANVLWDEESNHVLLTDFGLAYILSTGTEEVHRLTQTGVIVGDAQRISPEQRMGASVTDRADVFSLGVLGYELLTGVAPATGSASEEDNARDHVPPLDLAAVGGESDPELTDLLQRCLAPTPTHRPVAAEIARRLSQSPTRSAWRAPAAPEPVRRLAAVLFADIVGYSTVAAADERAALTLVGLLQRCAQDRVDEFSGRVVKFVGDGVLARFSSTESAVQAALALQSDFAEGSIATGIDASLRIGIHIGDVTTGADGDLYGDGVNTAARLQASAERGQVLVSGDVWRQLQSRPGYRFRQLGERDLKGLAARVQIVEVSRAGATGSIPSSSAEPGTAKRFPRPIVWAMLALAGIFTALVLWLA
jgi:class 3 adenylate cyclase